jgi:hypothetical protein
MWLASGITELRSGGSEEAILDYPCDPTRRVSSTSLIDTVVSIPNANVSVKEVTGNMSETSNFSASAMITITMTEILNE